MMMTDANRTLLQDVERLRIIRVRSNDSNDHPNSQVFDSDSKKLIIWKPERGRIKMCLTRGGGGGGVGGSHGDVDHHADNANDDDDDGWYCSCSISGFTKLKMLYLDSQPLPFQLLEEMSGLRSLKRLSLNVANVARHCESDRVESHDEAQSTSRRKLNLSMMSLDYLQLTYDDGSRLFQTDAGGMEDNTNGDSENERRLVLVDFLDGLSRMHLEELKINFFILQYVPLRTIISWGKTLQKVTVEMGSPRLAVDDVQAQQALKWVIQYWTELESLELHGGTYELDGITHRHNKRTKFPSDATFSNLMKLTTLSMFDMSRVPLSTMPPGLEAMRLYWCDIYAIPANTRLYFPNLQTLGLSSETLPPSNGHQWNCQQLRSLRTQRYYCLKSKITKETYRSQMLAAINLVFGAPALIKWTGDLHSPLSCCMEDEENVAHAARALVHRIECGRVSLQFMNVQIINSFRCILTRPEVATLQVSMAWNRGKEKVVDLPMGLWPYALSHGVAPRPFRLKGEMKEIMPTLSNDALREDTDARYQLLRRVMSSLGEVSSSSPPVERNSSKEASHAQPSRAEPC